MKSELEHIKKVEDDVADQIKKAKLKSDEEISKIRATRDKIIRDETDNANKKVDKLIEKSRKDAEKEAEDIIKESDNEIKKIRDISSKNMGGAIEVVLENLRDI